jgi:hypothetical protein
VKVFLGGVYGIIEERIGDISSAEYCECEEEGFHAHGFPRLE